MIRVRTRDWSPGDRVERWREEFGKRIIATEVTASGDAANLFSVDLLVQPGTQLALTRMRLKAVRKERDRSWFGDGADDLTLMICTGGTVRFDTASRRGLLHPGEIALFSHQVPVALDWQAGAILTLQIPRALLAPLGGVERFVGRVFSRGSVSARLLCVYAETVAAQADDLSPLAERHLVELAADALRTLDGAGALPESRRDAARAARLALMMRLIATHARDAGFGLEQAARAAGVSPRTAERDFACTGLRFGEAVVAARLAYARDRLSAGDAARISDIAYDAGFGDLSHFNRCFKASFGCSPSEWRGRMLMELARPGHPAG